MGNNFLAYVDLRLQQWADWFGKTDLYGLGLRFCTLEYRLMTEGALINSTAPKQFRSNRDAEEIEALVKEIERYNRKIGLALRSQYFDNINSSERAKKIGVSYPQFKILVDQGRIWLAGRLSANAL